MRPNNPHPATCVAQPSNPALGYASSVWWAPPDDVEPTFDLVIPSVGRASLHTLLDTLRTTNGPRPATTLIVDDRRTANPRMDEVDLGRRLGSPVHVLASGGRGPAAARNLGWCAGASPWIAFLDDDVVPGHEWLALLARDLGAAPVHVGGVQGIVRVPLPSHRPPTDWERNVRGLQDARWITADMAYRRRALEHVNGFDESFPRAYREDADLALRLADRGWGLVVGARWIIHPVGRVGALTSVRRQLGNADDARMRSRHGRDWRARAGVAPGRRRRHAVICAFATAALAATCARRRRVAVLFAGGWLAGTAEFAWARIRPGPRDRREVLTMAVTSALIPFVAVGAWLTGAASNARRRRPGGAGLRGPARMGLLARLAGKRSGTNRRCVDPGRLRPGSP